jgi:hypothetical protein
MAEMVRFTPLLVALAMLTACFVSDEPLIEQGARIHDGPVAFCVADSEICHNAGTLGDGYLVRDTEGETPMRFVPLTEAPDGPVWLGEAELGDEDGRAWVYVIARPESLSADGTMNFRVVMTDCALADDAMRARFGFSAVDPYSCLTPDLESLSAYLLERHGADFTDPDWWLNQN